MIQIDWDKAPKWANYHAFDEDRQGFWYGVKPKLLRGIGIWGLVSGIAQKSDLSPTFKNYQKSLTRRPGYSEKPNTHSTNRSEKPNS